MSARPGIRVAATACLGASTLTSAGAGLGCAELTLCAETAPDPMNVFVRMVTLEILTEVWHE